MVTPNLFQVLASWPIEPPTAMTPLAGGTNNQTWLVDTADASYVLRLSHSIGAVERAHVQYEMALLTALRAKPLAFAIPCPFLTHQDEAFLLVEQGEESVMALLTPFLPGSIPERTVLNIARAGTALAELDAALASIPALSLPANSGAADFRYGDLLHCHPLVTNPFATVEQILGTDQARVLCAILEQSQKDWEHLYLQNLPQQILHRDCGPGNVLMESERVTAILDFEFAG